MLAIIRTATTSVAYIFLGIMSGWMLDFWQQYNTDVDSGIYKSSYDTRISREYKYMDNQWNLMKKSGLLDRYLNKPGSSTCDFDGLEGCGDCVKL